MENSAANISGGYTKGKDGMSRRCEERNEGVCGEKEQNEGVNKST
jgi:hypothetical protein